MKFNVNLGIFLKAFCKSISNKQFALKNTYNKRNIHMQLTTISSMTFEF